MQLAYLKYSVGITANAIIRKSIAVYVGISAEKHNNTN